MDPDVALAQMRLLAVTILKAADDEPDEPWTAVQMSMLAVNAIELAENVQVLDAWIRGGGFPPDSWPGLGVAACDSCLKEHSEHRGGE